MVQLYFSMINQEIRVVGASKEEVDQAKYLLTSLHRLSFKVDEWQSVALAVLMQHQLRHISTKELLELLRNLERLSWACALCRWSRKQRELRWLQVRCKACTMGASFG